MTEGDYVRAGFARGLEQVLSKRHPELVWTVYVGKDVGKDDDARPFTFDLPVLENRCCHSVEAIPNVGNEVKNGKERNAARD
jgi:hypothetical protein